MFIYHFISITPHTESSLESLVMFSSNVFSEEFVLSNLKASPFMNPFFTPGGEEDSDLDSDDDENPADVVFGGMPLRTISGRTVIRPNRLDL